MKPVLFDANAVTFNNNGIGILHDATYCSVYEEHNGVFDAELEYPASGEWANSLVEKNIILAKPNDADAPHAFRIYEVDKTLSSEIIFIRATSITDDLGGNLIRELKAEDDTPQMVMDEMKAKLIEPTRFDFVSDINTRSSTEWTRVNPLQAIVGIEGSLVDYWGGDVKRTNDTVYLYSRRGRDKVTVIRPGKNIEGFNMVVSTKGVVTKILPFFTYTFNGLTEYEMVRDHNGDLVKQAKQNDIPIQSEPKLVYGEVVVSDLADSYPVNYYNPIDYSSDSIITEQVNAYIEAKQLELDEAPGAIDASGFPAQLENYIYDLLNTEASRYFTYTNPGVDKPKVTIKVDMMQLSDSPDWEKFKKLEEILLTDTVEVYVAKFNVDVEVTINSIRYDVISEKITSITAGNAQTSLARSVTQPYVDKTKELQKYIEKMENGVYNSITRTANGINKKFSGYTEPSAELATEGDIWFREMGNGVVELYIYDGAHWQPLMNGDVIEEIRENLDYAIDLADYAEIKAQGIIDLVENIAFENGVTTLEELFASKISTDEFGTLFFQQSNAIGLVYEEDGETKSIIMLDGDTPYIKGENIVLDGDTIVDGSFTVTEEMLSERAVINQLIANGIDANDVRIINLDASSITGGDLDVTDRFRILSNGVTVFEVDANTGQVNIRNSNLATKEELEAIELTPGADGKTAYDIAVDNGFIGTEQEWIDSLTGARGANGKTAYDIAVDNGFSGTEQQWLNSLIGPQGPRGIQGIQGPEGNDGIQGPKGEDGLHSYTHIAYAANSTGTSGFSTSDSVGALYIGMYVDHEQADSTDPSRYAWTRIKGADGADGIRGPAGEDGRTPYFHIAYATSANGSTGFSTTDSVGKTYIGTYTDYTAADSTDPTKYSWTLIKGEKGDQGPQGVQGAPGIPGPKGADGQSQYVYIRYSTNSNGNPMSVTPQDNTKYIGIANTTSSTAPSSYSAYTWSLFMGRDGADGIPGAKGADGRTTYTWVRYAEDKYGGNMSDTPAGKRYIGLAFNKTTATESDNASDYKWSPLYDNIIVGGVNLILGSKDLALNSNNSTVYPIEDEAIDNHRRLRRSFPDGYTSTALSTYSTLFFDAKANEPYTLSLSVKPEVDVTLRLNNLGTRFECEAGEWTTIYHTITYDTAGSQRFMGIYSEGITPEFNPWIEYRHPQAEKGNVPSDYSEAPEDIRAVIDEKAGISDLDNLAEIVSTVSSELNFKAGMGEFEALEEAFNARLAQDILDKEQLAADLATIEGRTTLIETLAGESKLVTEFVNTVITESEEGIFIANGSNSTGILISEDRISFMDNNVEVAYISNQTMQISHGIFVESATISGFKFEKIPDTEILSITWVGDA